MKNESSNFFDDRMYSIVASKISVLISSLSDGFPNRSVFVKLGKVKWDTWGSVMLKLMPRVHFKLRKKLHWRKKVSAKIDYMLLILNASILFILIFSYNIIK